MRRLCVFVLVCLRFSRGKVLGKALGKALGKLLRNILGNVLTGWFWQTICSTISPTYDVEKRGESGCVCELGRGQGFLGGRFS